jgi:hypothetical protein
MNFLSLWLVLSLVLLFMAMSWFWLMDMVCYPWKDLFIYFLVVSLDFISF